MNKELIKKPRAFILAFTDGGPYHNISFLNFIGLIAPGKLGDRGRYLTVQA
jgi:hypothetical protein